MLTANYSNDAAFDAQLQTDLVFKSLNATIERNGMRLLDNTIRTWVYVGDVDNHYKTMVGARREYFTAQGLTDRTRYLASTGIEGGCQSPERIVSVDSLSIGGLRPEQVRARGHLTAHATMVPGAGEIEVRLEPARGRVTGVVLDERGFPVAGAVLELTGSANLRLRATSDRKGEFLLEGTPTGRLNLRVNAAGYPGWSKEGVAAGDDVRVALAPRGRLGRRAARRRERRVARRGPKSLSRMPRARCTTPASLTGADGSR